MQPFEFVLLDNPSLARQPDLTAFREHFSDGEADIVVFPNLGRNAILVVPCPVAEEFCYGHLAAFVRKAPKDQQDALWRVIANAMLQRINEVPVWLSTAGAGVSWLHVRLDDQPKYYGYAPYRQAPGNGVADD
ncbi:MAG: hypothetical protein R3B84_10560 [Zavarzinella sp.]